MKAVYYDKKEEIANVITHAIGIVLAIVALVVMVVYSANHGTAWEITSGSIFGATLIIMYTCSTLYHIFQKEKVKSFFRKLDHIAIFLLIAGSYTPFALVSLNGAWGWTIFGIIWGLAVFGVIYKLTPLNKFKKLSLILYLSMGWLVVIAAKPMIAAVDTGGLWLLLAGGLTYSLGVIFYVWDRLPYNHAIWHLFVLGGSIFHFCAIYGYVL